MAQWVLGYYVGYQVDQYPIADIDWSALTHIAYSPLLVKDDGSLDLSFYDPRGTGEATAKSLAMAAHAHDVKALLMLGGMGNGANIGKVAVASKRAAFVKALLGVVDSLGYDGIDINWEDSIEMDDLVALARSLREARPALVLSYPGGPINSNISAVDPKFVELAKSLDRFNVQTYFPSTAFAGSGWASWFNSPLSGVSGTTPVAIDDTLQRYAEAGIPKDKLGMGVAFYAICYTGDITAPRQPTEGVAIVGGDNDFPLSALFASGGALQRAGTDEARIDTDAKVPYLSLKTPDSTEHCGGQSSRYISYEDESSLMEKGAFSRKNGYGGVMIWTIQQGWLSENAAGGRSKNALMQALRAGFLEP